jgi:hypothetical protein
LQTFLADIKAEEVLVPLASWYEKTQVPAIDKAVMVEDISV